MLKPSLALLAAGLLAFLSACGGSASPCPPCPATYVCANGACWPPDTPSLHLSENSLQFTGFVGGAFPPSQTVVATSNGSAPLAGIGVSGWSVPGWLDVTLPNASGDNWYIAFQVHTDSLSVGTYTNEVEVAGGSAEGANSTLNSPQVVTVTLTMVP